MKSRNSSLKNWLSKWLEESTPSSWGNVLVMLSLVSSSCLLLAFYYSCYQAIQ